MQPSPQVLSARHRLTGSSSRRLRTALIAVVGAAIGCVAFAAHADEADCGPVTNAYGPYDYRTATAAQRRLVEHAHFTPTVELLTKGESTAYVGGDIDYTLRAFPNHPRALLAMSKLSLRDKRPRPTGATFTIECYFDRAFRFQPEDPLPRLVAGLHYTKQGRRAEALESLELAARLNTEGSANVYYNLGLAYLDLNEKDKALVNAKKAYEAGFPLPGLRDRLKQAGAWTE